jgi:hypothetical protein
MSASEIVGRTRQREAAVGPPLRADELGPLQVAEDVEQELQRDVLAMVAIDSAFSGSSPASTASATGSEFDPSPGTALSTRSEIRIAKSV